MAPELRFEPAHHEYFLDGVQIPSVTQMLVATGWIDPTYYTEESRRRGSIVHTLTAAYDLGTLDLDRVHQYRGYVLAYIEAMRTIRPTMLAIEEMVVHPGYPFAGKPDRVARMFGVLTIPEIKTGGRERAHAVQTALQAILVAGADREHRLPPTSYQRAAIYLKASGRYTLEQHPARRDFDHAYQVLHDCCPKARLR